MRLLPPNKETGWTPFVWLVFLGYFFVEPVMKPASPREWASTLLGVLIFLALYFRSYWLPERQKLWVLAGIGLLGLVYAPFNSGSAVFIIFFASLVPFAGSVRKAASAIAILLAAVAVEQLALRNNPSFWMPAVIFSIAIGAVNMHFAQTSRANRKLRMAQAEIESLARVAERERIARDLHDVLGHTLSVVVLKSELASKLIAGDPERAGNEIREVEQIAREALAEVRHAIGGYRATGLEDEMARAEATLRTAGVGVERRREPVELSAAQETVLALALREAVTNVVRHAGAKHCAVTLARESGYCHMEIADDGRGGEQTEGNGLRGMRERVEALGGTLGRDTSAGTKLTIRLPLTEHA